MPNLSLLNFLRQCDIFFNLSSTQLELIANIGREMVYQEGEIIFREHSAGKELYIILQGQVDILLSPTPNDQLSEETSQEDNCVSTLRRGQSFGEIALVDEGLHSATARAAQSDTRLFAIPCEHLIMLCETYPQLGYRLMSNLAANLALKIRNTDLRIRQQLLYEPSRMRKS